MRYRSHLEESMTAHAKTRLVALIGPISGQRYAVHTANYPMNPDKMLPVADVVLLVAEDDQSAMLFRYTAHGEFGGDTLHTTVAEAKEEAAEEYAEALLAWEDVPDDIDDAHLFAVRYAHDRLNDRGGWGSGPG
jgi:hypothetical protein